MSAAAWGCGAAVELPAATCCAATSAIAERDRRARPASASRARPGDLPPRLPRAPGRHAARQLRPHRRLPRRRRLRRARALATSRRTRRATPTCAGTARTSRDWLRAAPADDPDIGELAALDWALRRAFDGADAPVLGLADLAARRRPRPGTALVLALHPTCARLRLRHNTLALWQALDHDEVAAAGRSALAAAGRSAGLAPRPAAALPQPRRARGARARPGARGRGFGRCASASRTRSRKPTSRSRRAGCCAAGSTTDCCRHCTIRAEPRGAQCAAPPCKPSPTPSSTRSTPPSSSAPRTAPGIELYRAHIVRHAFDPHTHEAFGLGAIESGRGALSLPRRRAPRAGRHAGADEPRRAAHRPRRDRRRLALPHGLPRRRSVRRAGDRRARLVVRRGGRATTRRAHAASAGCWIGSGTPTTPLAFDGLLLDLLTSCRAHARAPRRRAGRGRAALRAGDRAHARPACAERITLDELAAVAGLSPFHFLRRFKRALPRHAAPDADGAAPVRGQAASRGRAGARRRSPPPSAWPTRRT